MKKLKSVEAERFISEVQTLIERGQARSFAEVAKSSGFASQDFTDIKSGKKDLQRKFLDAVSKTFDIDKSYVLTGEKAQKDLQGGNIMKTTPRRIQSNARLLGDMNEEEFGEDTKFRQISPGIFAMKVELVTDKAKAGWLRGFQDPEYHEELPTTEILVDFYHKGHYLAFVASGDSMNNGDVEVAIPDKTIIVGRELIPEKWAPRLYNHEWPNWVFVHRTEGILVKQIAQQNFEEGWVILRSLNPNKELYPDHKIYLKDVFRIYNVVKRQLP